MKKKILLFGILLFIVILGTITASATETVYVSDVSELQSAHPYSDYMDKTWVYTHPTNAKSLGVYFSDDTETEAGYDFIHIYDGNDNQIGTCSGTEIAGKIVIVPGNVVKIQLKSDGSKTNNGFAVIKIQENMTKEDIPKRIIAQGTCGENLAWTLDDYDTLTISGTDSMDSWDTFFNSNPPWYDRRKEIKSIVIEDGVTSIGGDAFTYCTNLISVTIPDSVRIIGVAAFYGCENLVRVTIGNGVRSIGEYAFYYCENLTRVTIGEGLKFIDNAGFGRCDNLKDVYYRGTKADWRNISIEINNYCLTEAMMHYIEFTKTTVDRYVFTVNPINIENGKTVILGLYNGNMLSEVQTAIYEGTEVTFAAAKPYEEAKVMVWDDLGSLKPVCDFEKVE